MSEAAVKPNLQSHILDALLASGIDPDLLAVKCGILRELAHYPTTPPVDPAELTRDDELFDRYVLVERMAFRGDTLTIAAQVWTQHEWLRYQAPDRKVAFVALHGEPWDNSDAWGLDEAETWGAAPRQTVYVWLDGEPRNIVEVQ
mgnify:CR=1 FL=1